MLTVPLNPNQSVSYLLAAFVVRLLYGCRCVRSGTRSSAVRRCGLSSISRPFRRAAAPSRRVTSARTYATPASVIGWSVSSSTSSRYVRWYGRSSLRWILTIRLTAIAACWWNSYGCVLYFFVSTFLGSLQGSHASGLEVLECAGFFPWKFQDLESRGISHWSWNVMEINT